MEAEQQEQRSNAASADRPLASDALIVRLEHPPTADAVDGAKLPDDYRAAVADNDVIVYRPVSGNLARTAAGCDRFREQAGEVVAALRAL